MVLQSKRAAKEMQDSLLSQYDFDWNTVGQDPS
jgi:hypothetical protein